MMVPPSFDNKDMLLNIGIAITSFRSQIGISQEILSERTGISRATISDIESPNRERNFTVDYLIRISEGLEIPTSVLIRRAEDFGRS